jgi:DNA-binding beta-propeller fold protein YncE
MDASGYLYVTDTSNNRIRKIMSDGTITTFAGSTNGYLDGVGTAARFNYPIGICASDDGMLYIGESGGNKIRKITTSLSSTPFINEDIVNIYPNPSSQSIHVEFDNLSTVKIDITDGNGRLLKSLNNVVNQCLIDISEFANGIYFLQLQTDNDIIVKKILKK